jgi:GTPase SAR1 family protein
MSGKYVLFLVGASGVGKSSAANALCDQKCFPTSDQKNDCTTSISLGVTKDGHLIVDTPGLQYGRAGNALPALGPYVDDGYTLHVVLLTFGVRATTSIKQIAEHLGVEPASVNVYRRQGADPKWSQLQRDWKNGTLKPAKITAVKATLKPVKKKTKKPVKQHNRKQIPLPPLPQFGSLGGGHHVTLANLKYEFPYAQLPSIIRNVEDMKYELYGDRMLKIFMAQSNLRGFPVSVDKDKNETMVKFIKAKYPQIKQHARLIYTEAKTATISDLKIAAIFEALVGKLFDQHSAKVAGSNGFKAAYKARFALVNDFLGLVPSA